MKKIDGKNIEMNGDKKETLIIDIDEGSKDS